MMTLLPDGAFARLPTGVIAAEGEAVAVDIGLGGRSAWSGCSRTRQGVEEARKEKRSSIWECLIAPCCKTRSAGRLCPALVKKLSIAELS